MEYRHFLKPVAAIFILGVTLMLAGCGTSGGSTSDLDQETSIAVGGNDGWWIDAPITKAPKKDMATDNEGPEKESSE